jgi:hypothetical protein
VEDLSQKLMEEQGVAPDIQRLFLAKNNNANRSVAEDTEGGTNKTEDSTATAMPRYARVNTLQLSMASPEVQTSPLTLTLNP